MAEPTRIDRGLASDRPQGHRRRCRPGVASPRSSPPAALRPPRPPRRAPPPRRCAAARRRAAARSRERRHGLGHLRFELLGQGHRRRPCRPWWTRSPQQTGIAVKVNTVDHGTFQDQISPYLQGTPDDVFTWFAGYRMRFFADQGLATDISDVWARSAPTSATPSRPHPRATTASSTSCRSTTIRGSSSTARASSTDKGYTVPKTLDEFKTLADEDEDRWPHPARVRRQGRLARDGHIRHPEHRENGYQYHIELMKGGRSGPTRRSRRCSTVWKTLLPFYQEGAAGRTWQDAAAGLVQKKAGMMLQPRSVRHSRPPARPIRRPRLLPVAQPWDPVGRREGARRADRRLHADREVADADRRHGRGQGVPRVPLDGSSPGDLHQDEHGQHRRGERCRCQRRTRHSSRRSRPRSSAAPRTSPSSSIATRARTSPGPRACRRS